MEVCDGGGGSEEGQGYVSLVVCLVGRVVFVTFGKGGGVVMMVRLRGMRGTQRGEGVIGGGENQARGNSTRVPHATQQRNTYRIHNRVNLKLAHTATTAPKFLHIHTGEERKSSASPSHNNPLGNNKPAYKTNFFSLVLIHTPLLSRLQELARIFTATCDFSFTHIFVAWNIWREEEGGRNFDVSFCVFTIFLLFIHSFIYFR